MARKQAASRRWWRWPLLVIAAVLLAIIGWVLGNGLRMLASEDQAHDRGGPGRGRWVQAHDVRIHITEQGAADAPLLVLVAGTGAWAGTWVSNIDAMLAAGWRVVTIDLPPFGFSARPADGNYGRHAQAERLLAAIRSLGRAPVVLLGHSYGGGPAAEAAMLEPALIRHLILVDAAIGLRTNQGTGSSGIPYLSRIPVIGALFGQQNSSNNRVQAILDLLSLGVFPLFSAAGRPICICFWNSHCQHAARNLLLSFSLAEEIITALNRFLRHVKLFLHLHGCFSNRESH